VFATAVETSCVPHRYFACYGVSKCVHEKCLRKKHGFDPSNVKDVNHVFLLKKTHLTKYCCKKRKNFQCLQHLQIMCSNCIKTSTTPDSED
jgi:hypothetical protein